MEAYCLDRTGLDLYGERVALDFGPRLRATLKFDGVDALLEQMAARRERGRGRSPLVRAAPPAADTLEAP